MIDLSGDKNADGSDDSMDLDRKLSHEHQQQNDGIAALENTNDHLLLLNESAPDKELFENSERRGDLPLAVAIKTVEEIKTKEDRSKGNEIQI